MASLLPPRFRRIDFSPMDIQVADTLLETLIDGRYRIRGQVARGGMATVYTAVDERLERTVALKIIHASQATNMRFLDRFTDEAKTIARLTHPNVVAVYDQGHHEGLPYLVMEYVQGNTLRELLSQRRRLSPVEALAILEQMLAAIAAAHRAGLVHRDVKPENVLVAEAPSGGPGNLVDGVVKVADFGLARAVEASSDDDSGGGQLMATVAYVAPELVAEGHADARTDVYSAGIVLFEMLTGRVPYDGDQPVEVAWQHVDNDVPAPSSIVPGLPTVLDDLVARATRRDPGARPTDAGALLTEVQVVRDDLGAASVDTAVLRLVSRPPRNDDDTAVVPAVALAPLGPARPPWARLPDQPRSRGQRRRQSGLSNRLAALSDAMGGQRARIAVLASVIVAGLVVLGTAYWLGIGRYTEAPELVNLPRAQAEAAAARAGFTLVFADGAHDEEVDRDVVLRQDPASGQRVVRGGTLTLVLSLGPERYPVPDVVGMVLDTAKAELEAIKLVAKEGPTQFSDDLPKGVVVSVAPKPGTSLKPGATVTLIVSKGRAPITVPNVVGRNINDARGMLQQLGLVVVEQYEDSDKPADEVIAQTPENGGGLEAGGEVKLTVSKGPPMTVVPRVLDMPCDQARQTLESQGFRVRIEFNPNGVVRNQNPGENTPVPPQTEVVIQCF
jgi:eukaryotic-like serine/threonine-protein kinase